MFDLSKLNNLSIEQKEELLQLLEERKSYVNYNKLEFFDAYDFQKEFYKASSQFKRRFLCAANRVGKSFSEAMEVAWHLTGKYPDWWEGHKFTKPILCWCVGITGDSTRKVLQKELFGTSMGKDQKALGTGAIPRDDIDFEQIEKDGHRVLMAKIKWHDSEGVHQGYSTLEFRSTQQGEHVLMGATVDYIWLDKILLCPTRHR